ncbi:hypothetical protein NIES4103_21810 [Nostoc sp. NIES-4103]|nr:hypothetical protein NIES4103_21810 [Nostoc sp. NIES-4103]
MTTLDAFRNELESWDELKTYLESLPSNQVGGMTGDFKFHPMALYLRLKYQDESVKIDSLISSMNGHEVLTPVWLREYLTLFTRPEQELYTVDTCLALLNRVIGELTPPPQPQPSTD